MVIKMNHDKSLVITIPTTIYRGESKADLIRFLVPMNYEDINVADCAMVMRYILPNGEGRSEPLAYLPEPYKDYLQFSTVVNTRLTADDGDVTLWLTAFNGNDELVLKTGESIVTIYPSKDITDYMSGESLDELEALSVKVAELESLTEELDDNKADNLVYDSDTKTMQLTSDGELIGDPVDMSKVVSENETPPEDESDDKVIYF